MSKRKYKHVRVTQTHDFFVYEGEDLDKVIKEWFEDGEGRSHAYRDNSQIGNSDKYVSHEIVGEFEM